MMFRIGPYKNVLTVCPNLIVSVLSVATFGVLNIADAVTDEPWSPWSFLLFIVALMPEPPIISPFRKIPIVTSPIASMTGPVGISGTSSPSTKVLTGSYCCFEYGKIGFVRVQYNFSWTGIFPFYRGSRFIAFGIESYMILGSVDMIL